MRSATEMHSKARLWQARTVSGAPPGSGASPAPALPLAAMRAPRERRSQSQAKSSPSWKATKRSSAKAAKSGFQMKDKWPCCAVCDILTYSLSICFGTNLGHSTVENLEMKKTRKSIG
uniref:Uncharacterized protein n=1 Tax=Chrysemys picta bellii TaxID=8478 RepID=A0A8C3IHN9_CHRPI